MKEAPRTAGHWISWLYSADPRVAQFWQALVGQFWRAAKAEQTFGNFRALANLANELLVEAAKRELDVIDEKLFLDYVASRSPRSTAATRRQGRTKSKRT